MSLTYTTKHGFKFLIDTMDWHHHDDAEKCSDAIDTMMNAWTAEECAKYHAALICANNDEIDWNDPAIAPIHDLENEASSAILSEYASWPDVGHNASIGAAA